MPPKSNRITAEYNHEIAWSHADLAKSLHLPRHVIEAFSRAGVISYPVTESEYDILAALFNALGTHGVIRSLLSHMSIARRQELVRTADLNRMEIAAYNYVLRWKLERLNKKPQQYLYFDEFSETMQARFPNGYKRLSRKVFTRAKKSADYQISKAIKAGTLNDLVRQLNMGFEADGRIVNERKLDVRTLRKASRIREANEIIRQSREQAQSAEWEYLADILEVKRLIAIRDEALRNDGKDGKDES
jgi:hypothetical protein